MGAGIETGQRNRMEISDKKSPFRRIPGGLAVDQNGDFQKQTRGYMRK